MVYYSILRVPREAPQTPEPCVMGSQLPMVPIPATQQLKVVKNHGFSKFGSSWNRLEGFSAAVETAYPPVGLGCTRLHHWQTPATSFSLSKILRLKFHFELENFGWSIRGSSPLRLLLVRAPDLPGWVKPSLSHRERLEHLW